MSRIATELQLSKLNNTGLQRFAFLQTLTSYSSILWVTLIAPDSRASRAVNKFAFIATAANLIQEYGASASTKVGISKSHCICWEQHVPRH